MLDDNEIFVYYICDVNRHTIINHLKKNYMSGVNKVILVGNVGKDPEVKYLEGGVAVAKLPLATSETYKNRDGQKVEQTEWHNIVLWRGLAEIAEKYVRKGNKLYIEGKIRTRSYEENNVKKYFTEIVADNMTMLGGGPRVDSNGSEAPAELASTGTNDDLPF
jgi:single-strand DNA-binding protein